MRFGLALATAFIVLAGSVASAAAQTRPVKGETIKALISGGTIQLDTPIGATLPLNFAPDGTVTGSSAVLAFYLGSTKDHGRWWISGNKLCTKFSRWFDREESCLLIRPEGRKFAWTKDNGDTGTASIISNTKRLYGSGSALTGGVSAAAMVRHAEERMAAAAAAATKSAAAAAKPVQLATLSVPTLPKPKVQSPAQSSHLASTPPPVALAEPEGPYAWLPMRVVKAAFTAVPSPEPAVTENLAPPVAAAPPSTFKVARVNADDVLNVRGSPQPEAEIIGSIPSTARGLVMGGICQAEWCPISYQRQIGWVNRQFLETE
jgi:hypothetical protein